MAGPEPEPDGGRPSLLALAGWRGRRGWLRGLALALLTLAILALLLSRIEFGALSAAVQRLPAGAWATVLLIALLLPLNLSLRWRFVLAQIGLSVPWRRCLAILLGVQPLSVLSPARVGDTLRAFALRRDGIAAPVLGGILAERLLDMLVLAAAAGAAALWLGRLGIALGGGAVLVAGFAALMLARRLDRLPLRPSWRQPLGRFAEAAAVFQRRPRALLGALALTLLHWALAILMVTVLLAGAGAEVGYAEVAAALPLAVFAGLLPVTFGGIGTRDAALVALLAAQAGAPECLAASLLYAFLTLVLPALVGLALTRRALDL